MKNNRNQEVRHTNITLQIMAGVPLVIESGGQDSGASTTTDFAATSSRAVIKKLQIPHMIFKIHQNVKIG